VLHLDRGGVYFVSCNRVTERIPEVPITRLPFMVGYALRVQSLTAAERAVERAGLDWHTFEDGITAAFPVELGEGAWFFVEDADKLP
jgi:hypothetical protein